MRGYEDENRNKSKTSSPEAKAAKHTWLFQTACCKNPNKALHSPRQNQTVVVLPKCPVTVVNVVMTVIHQAQ